MRKRRDRSGGQRGKTKALGTRNESARMSNHLSSLRRVGAANGEDEAGMTRGATEKNLKARIDGDSIVNALATNSR